MFRSIRGTMNESLEKSRLARSNRLKRSQNCPICGERMDWTAMDSHMELVHRDFEIESRRYIMRALRACVVLGIALVCVPFLWMALLPESFARHSVEIVLGVTLLGGFGWLAVLLILMNVIPLRTIELYRDAWRGRGGGANRAPPDGE
jgi:hypothetical protein